MSEQSQFSGETESQWSTVCIKLAISIGVLVLLAIQLAAQLKIEPETIALVVLAVLPWLSTIVESVDLPGGGRVQFREVKAVVQSQQAQLQHQQEIINQLVVYSMSFFIFSHLRELYHRNKDGREFLFRNNDAFARDLRFLRDHGYLEHFHVGDLHDGQNLTGFVKLTPVGNFYVEVREALEQKSKAKLAEKLGR